MSPIRLASWLAGTVASGFLIWRCLNYHPPAIEPVEPRNIETAPYLLPGQRIRVVTFNVQFLAGTGYHFFYDGGPDTLVARRDIELTARKVGEFIAKCQAALVLLQEVDC